MKQGLILFVGVLAALWVLQAAVGFRVAAQLAYGGLTALSLAIAATFLWLWRERATPLALGMAFSWAGAASVTGWWSFARGLDQASWMRGHPALFLCLALYMTGAILHFAVIGRSLDPVARDGLILGTAVAAALAIAASLF